MERNEIDRILTMHKIWLDDQERGQAGFGVRASFYNGDLSGQNLTGVDLRRADLRNTNLSGANLTDANLQYADITGAIMHNVTSSGLDLSHAIHEYGSINFGKLPCVTPKLTPPPDQFEEAISATVAFMLLIFNTFIYIRILGNLFYR